MGYFLWCSGRALQLVALVQVGAALFIGFSTQDSRLELKLMLLGVVEFMLGLLIVSKTGQKE